MSTDNIGRKKARPGRFCSSTPATCTGKGNLFFNLRLCIVPCAEVRGKTAQIRGRALPRPSLPRSESSLPTVPPTLPHFIGAAVVVSALPRCGARRRAPHARSFLLILDAARFLLPSVPRAHGSDAAPFECGAPQRRWVSPRPPPSHPTAHGSSPPFPPPPSSPPVPHFSSPCRPSWASVASSSRPPSTRPP